MLKRVSQYLGLPPGRLTKLGAFDGFVNRDVALFLNPILLENIGPGHFEHAYDRVAAHVRTLMAILSASSGEDDAWNKALDVLCYEEYPELGLGYSRTGTRGTAISLNDRRTLLEGLRQIVKAEVTNPGEFCTVMLFEDSLGPDHISDFVASVIYEDIIQYSHHTLLEAGVPLDSMKKFQFRNIKYRLPEHPEIKRRPLLILPERLLSRPPRGISIGAAPLLFPARSPERKQVADFFVKVAKHVSKDQRRSKFRTSLLENPGLLGKVSRALRNALAEEYDHDNDPAGIMAWFDAAMEAQETSALSFPAETITSSDELKVFIDFLLRHFKKLVEDQGFSRVLHERKTKKPRHEDFIHSFLYAVADIECERLNLKMVMHARTPGHELDFLISRGNLCGVIEVKWSKNSSLIDAPHQLVKYGKAHSTDVLFLLVVRSEEYVGKMKRLEEIIEKEAKTVRLVNVDGSWQESASHGRTVKAAG